jgi:viologen exporter family transport system ATP-binding protein
VIVVNHGSIVLDDNVKNLKYSFFNRKIVEVRMEAELKLDCPGVALLKQKDYAAKLEVDLSKISMEAAFTEIARSNKILDITVTNPPMEEVIAEIYGRAAPAGGKG